MNTLILGHGRYYEKEDVRCSPIDVDEWFNDTFDCVDDLEDVEPDILFDLRSRIWKFAEDNSYDRIVDCTGGILSRGGYDRQVEEKTLNDIQRILRPGGIFYSDRRVNYVCYKERDGSLKKIDKTITIRNPEIVLLNKHFSVIGKHSL
jgi:hypothetical protein